MSRLERVLGRVARSDARIPWERQFEDPLARCRAAAVHGALGNLLDLELAGARQATHCGAGCGLMASRACNTTTEVTTT